MAFWQNIVKNKIVISGSGSILALVLFFSMLSIYGVTTSISGDILCNGTAPYTCISYINISTSNYSIKFPSTVFSIEGNTSYVLYKKDIAGSWRKYNLSGKTMPTDSKMELKLVGTKKADETVTIKVSTGGRNSEQKWYGLSNKNESINWNEYKKNADYSGVILSSKPIEKCSYKPNGQNDGYKICTSIVQIENTLPVTISLSKPKIDINIKTKYSIKYNYPLTLNPFEKANVSMSYEIKQYSKASYNFSIKASGFDIDLDPDVSVCGNLDQANSVYTLTGAITGADTCLYIKENNITLNCAFNTVTYQTATLADGQGIKIDGSYYNTTITNCTIIAELYKSASAGISGGASPTETNISYNTISSWSSTEGGCLHFDNSIKFEFFNNSCNGKAGTESTRVVELRTYGMGTFKNNQFIRQGMYSSGNYIIDAASQGNYSFINNYFENINIHPSGDSKALLISGNISMNGDVFKINGSYTNLWDAYAIRFDSGKLSLSNIIINITANNSEGIMIAGGNTIIDNATVYTKESLCQAGAGFGYMPAGLMMRGGNTNVSNSTFKTYTSHAISMNTGTNKITDSKLLYDTTCTDAIVVHTGGEFDLVNTTYNYSDPKTINFTTGATGKVHRSWYFDAIVNDTSGNLLDSARVTAVNITNGIVLNQITGTNGQIALRPYIKEMTRDISSILYYNNHTINATKTAYSVNIISLNITNNTVKNFTLKQVFYVYTKNPLHINYSVSTLTFNVSLALAGTNCWYNLNGTGNVSMTKLNSTWFNKEVTNIPDGNHNVSFLCNSTSNEFNTTDLVFFNVDTTNPVISYAGGTPSNNTNRSLNSIFLNITYNETNYQSTIFYLYNSDGTLNTSRVHSNSTNYTNFTGLVDGTYGFSATINDSVNNKGVLSNRTVTLDTTIPQIAYSGGTEDNMSYKNRSWIYVNVTLNETNFANITFNLYNATHTNINSTKFIINSAGNRLINWTNQAQGIYYYNVTVTDEANNKASLDTRQITLDVDQPKVNITTPTNDSAHYFISGNNLTFYYNYSDLSPVMNCSLILNSTKVTYNTSVISPNIQLNFSYGLGTGKFNWSINCTDIINQQGNSTTWQFNTSVMYTINDTYTPDITRLVFKANASKVNGTEPINQTPLIGTYNIHNNRSFDIDVIMRLNETNQNITLKSWSVYDYANSKIITTEWVIVNFTLKAGDSTYLWLWADYNNPRKKWSPSFEIYGREV